MYPNTPDNIAKGRNGKSKGWWNKEGKTLWVQLGSPKTLAERNVALATQSSSSHQPEQSGGSSGSESDQSSSSHQPEQSGGSSGEASSEDYDADFALWKAEQTAPPPPTEETTAPPPPTEQTAPVLKPPQTKLALYTFQRVSVNPKDPSQTKVVPTEYYLLDVPEHPLPDEFQTHSKMGQLLGPFKAQLGGDHCDVPDQIATDTTKTQGTRKDFPAKHNADGSLRKPAYSVWDMKNRAYPTLVSALEQIEAYASHKLPRTSGRPHGYYDKKGCGVPCGVVWTARGSKSGGHYRIRWGYIKSDKEPYTQSKGVVYGGADPDQVRTTGRSPAMLWQPDFHDKTGSGAKSFKHRKSIQSSLCWVWSGSITAQQSYGAKADSGCFFNKRKWDGLDVSPDANWEFSHLTDGGRRYVRAGGDKTNPADILDFNRPPKAKAKKGKKSRKSQSTAEQTQTSQATAEATDKMEQDLQAYENDDDGW
jgi:hypothetical protein